MLKQLMKHFNKADDADNKGVDEQMSTLTTGADAGAELAQALDSVKTMSTQLEDATKALTDAKAQIAELSAIIQTNKEMTAAAEAKALEAKMASRKEQIVAAVGTDKAETLMNSTKDLDDKSFSAVMAVVTLSVDKEANTPLFKEAGVDGKVDADKAVDEGSSLRALLVAKYKTN